MDAQRLNRRRGTQRTNREEGPVRIGHRFGGARSTVGRRGRGATSRGAEAGKPAGAAPRPPGTSRPGPGGNSQGNRQFHPMCGETRCIVPAQALRASARIPRAPPTARCRERPASQRDRGRIRSRKGRVRATDCGGVDPRRRPPQVPVERATVGQPARRDLHRDWTRPEGAGTSKKFTRGCRVSLLFFSSRGTCDVPIRATPGRQLENGQGGGGSGKANEPRTDRRREEKVTDPGRPFCRIP